MTASLEYRFDKTLLLMHSGPGERYAVASMMLAGMGYDVVVDRDNEHIGTLAYLSDDILPGYDWDWIDEGHLDTLCLDVDTRIATATFGDGL